jgi:hypothetical protein
MPMFSYEEAFDWRFLVVRLFWRYMAGSPAIKIMHLKRPVLVVSYTL